MTPRLRLATRAGVALCPRCSTRTEHITRSALGERWAAGIPVSVVRAGDAGLFVEVCPTDCLTVVSHARVAAVRAWLARNPGADFGAVDDAHPWWPTDVRWAWRELHGMTVAPRGELPAPLPRVADGAGRGA